MRKRVVFLIFVILGGAAWWVMRPSGFDTGSPLIASSEPVGLLDDLNTQDLSEGWVHRKFLTISAADYAMVEEDGKQALRCRTDASASIFVRDMQIALDDLPILSWEWKVTQPIDSDLDEATKEGDDHPVRFFAVFKNDSDEAKAMEIIWSNRKFAPGEYKIIGDFYHYVANGLDENVGSWHAQRVDLRQIYADIGGTGTPTLDTLGFFCDSDDTGTQSEGFFADVMLSAEQN